MKPKKQKRIEALERMERSHSGSVDRRNKPGPARTPEQREREMSLLALSIHRAKATP